MEKRKRLLIANIFFCFSPHRSNDQASWDVSNVLTWISMLQDLYEKFDYNDLECQKKLICEVMREPDFYGSAAQKIKTGFK